MKILLTGASSYVGARLYFDLIKNFEVIGTYNNQQLSNEFIKLDVTNNTEVKRVIITHKPNIIIHAANNANVRWCETNPQQATELNENSTKYLVDVANGINAKIIYISSFAARSTLNIYGKTKKNSEDLVRNTYAGYVIFQPSLIIGYSPNTTNDRPFNRILKNIDERTPAVYDSSWKFQPAYIRHISEIIKIVIERNINKEIIPIAASDLKSRFDIAKDILTHFGIKVQSVDKQDTTPILTDNLTKLSELNLPIYTYSQMIDNIIEEIKQRKIFTLS